MILMINDLLNYDLKIYQDDNAFKFSIDSVLLAEFVNINYRCKNIIDLCTGNAPIPMILSTKFDKNIIGVELQKRIFELGLKSININMIKNIELINADVNNIVGSFNYKFDIITCNPPYFKVEDKNYLNDDLKLAIARHEIKIDLETIFKIASSHLDDKGEFYLVHRVTRLDEIIIYANKYNLNVKNIELIKTKEDCKPYILLVRCIKNSKYGVKINNIKNIENQKTYQNMFQEDL